MILEGGDMCPNCHALSGRLTKAEQERDEARRDRDHYGAKLDDLLNGNTYTEWVDRARKAEARVAALEAGITALADDGSKLGTSGRLLIWPEELRALIEKDKS